ncbi:MAG: hypothetical protein JNM39_18575 [Bdellovibrionaceae bacterium]|nr:hypothetical protein [Pseudobdellovibrionaceae bacterium]
MISGLAEAVSFERGRNKLKTVERELAPPAPEFSKAEIKRLRIEVLDCTQLEFASLLNVDIGTFAIGNKACESHPAPFTVFWRSFLRSPKLLRSGRVLKKMLSDEISSLLLIPQFDCDKACTRNLLINNQRTSGLLGREV